MLTARLVAVCAVLAVFVVLFVAAVFFGQRGVLFPAPRLTIDRGERLAEVVRLASRSWTAEALFLPATAGHGGPAPLIIFTHGNGELADQWTEQFAEPRSWGWVVLLLEYPGYGRSTGTPSEQSIVQVAAAAYDWARQDARVDATRIVAYGRSLGGGPAAWLAANRSPAGIILESAFTSTRPLAARYLIPGFLVRDPFDNLSALRGYQGPLLVVHGRDDNIVPVAHGRALAAAVPGAEFHELGCGHNDCPRPWALVRAFLLTRGLTSSAAGGVPP